VKQIDQGFGLSLYLFAARLQAGLLVISA